MQAMQIPGITGEQIQQMQIHHQQQQQQLLLQHQQQQQTMQLTANPNQVQHTATYCNTLQHTATHCNILQHTATYCNTLQHPATYCNTLRQTMQLTANPNQVARLLHFIFFTFLAAGEMIVTALLLHCGVSCIVLQCAQVCCSVLQSSR